MYNEKWKVVISRKYELVGCGYNRRRRRNKPGLISQIGCGGARALEWVFPITFPLSFCLFANGKFLPPVPRRNLRHLWLSLVFLHSPFAAFTAAFAAAAFFLSFSFFSYCPQIFPLVCSRLLYIRQRLHLWLFLSVTRWDSVCRSSVSFLAVDSALALDRVFPAVHFFCFAIHLFLLSSSVYVLNIGAQRSQRCFF